MLDVRVVIFSLSSSTLLKVQGLVRQGYRKEFRFACNVYFRASMSACCSISMVLTVLSRCSVTEAEKCLFTVTKHRM